MVFCACRHKEKSFQISFGTSYTARVAHVEKSFTIIGILLREESPALCTLVVPSEVFASKPAQDCEYSLLDINYLIDGGSNFELHSSPFDALHPYNADNLVKLSLCHLKNLFFRDDKCSEQFLSMLLPPGSSSQGDQPTTCSNNSSQSEQEVIHINDETLQERVEKKVRKCVCEGMKGSLRNIPHIDYSKEKVMDIFSLAAQQTKPYKKRGRPAKNTTTTAKGSKAEKKCGKKSQPDTSKNTKIDLVPELASKDLNQVSASTANRAIEKERDALQAQLKQIMEDYSKHESDRNEQQQILLQLAKQVQTLQQEQQRVQQLNTNMGPPSFPQPSSSSSSSTTFSFGQPNVYQLYYENEMRKKQAKVLCLFNAHNTFTELSNTFGNI